MSGGAWKVAYADFVTAMMALFMVLWISAQDEKILIATSQYFQNPFNSPMNNHSGVLPFNSEKTKQSSGDDAGTESESAKTSAVSMTFLNSVAADFYRLLNLDQDLADAPIDIQVTSDGMRITLFDRPDRPLFQPDKTDFTPWGEFAMQNLAWMIDRHRFRVTVDGHTHQKANPDPNNPLADDEAWELSANRANASRRKLVFFAVDAGLIERVTGYADTKPLEGKPRDDPANDRITLSLTLAGTSQFKDRVSVDPPSKP
ncbi:MAG TPA: flagellar motor protein MotB [Opitutaceae bacterium]